MPVFVAISQAGLLFGVRGTTLLSCDMISSAQHRHFLTIDNTPTTNLLFFSYTQVTPQVFGREGKFIYLDHLVLRAMGNTTKYRVDIKGATLSNKNL